mmetsp:Transcript_17158/g.19133  ORF Transcript_17158/g.19133 Transcript_17158/m.19133 type:complete len:234 (+) Transcript_17158:56-757(+)
MSVCNAVAYLVYEKLQERMQCGMEDSAVNSVFHQSQKPQIELVAYMQRFVRYTTVNDEVFLVSLIYLKRFLTKNSRFVLNEHSVHRLFLTCVLAALKFWVDGDCRYGFNYFSRVAGVDPPVLLALETKFLNKMSFDLHIAPDEYSACKTRVDQAILFLPADCSTDLTTPPTGTKPTYNVARNALAVSLRKRQVRHYKTFSAAVSIFETCLFFCTYHLLTLRARQMTFLCVYLR